MSFKNRNIHVQWKCLDCGVGLRDHDHPDDTPSARWDSERCRHCWTRQISMYPIDSTPGAPIYYTKGVPRPKIEHPIPYAMGDICGYCGEDLNGYNICTNYDCSRRFCRDCGVLVTLRVNGQTIISHQPRCEPCHEKVRVDTGYKLRPPVPEIEAWEKFDIPWLGTAEEWARGIDVKVQRSKSKVRTRRKAASASVEVGDEEAPAATGDAGQGGDMESESSSEMEALEC